MRQVWTVSKINTIPSLCAKLFEITLLKAKEIQSMAVSLLKVSNKTLET